MRSPDDPHCQFGLPLSHVELDALLWLMEVTEKIGKNQKSCNRRKAALAASVLDKMRDAIYDMHDDLHLADERMSEMANELDFNDLAKELAKRTSIQGLN